MEVSVTIGADGEAGRRSGGVRWRGTGRADVWEEMRSTALPTRIDDGNARHGKAAG